MHLDDKCHVDKIGTGRTSYTWESTWSLDLDDQCHVDKRGTVRTGFTWEYTWSLDLDDQSHVDKRDNSKNLFYMGVQEVIRPG